MQKKTTLHKTKEPEPAEQQYQSSRAYLQAVIDSLDDELMVIDRDLRITQVNKAVLKRHGSTKSKVIGQHCYQVSHGVTEPCQPPSCQCPMKKV